MRAGGSGRAKVRGGYVRMKVFERLSRALLPLPHELPVDPQLCIEIRHSLRRGRMLRVGPPAPTERQQRATAKSGEVRRTKSDQGLEVTKWISGLETVPQCFCKNGETAPLLAPGAKRGRAQHKRALHWPSQNVGGRTLSTRSSQRGLHPRPRDEKGTLQT